MKLPGNKYCLAIHPPLEPDTFAEEPLLELPCCVGIVDGCRRVVVETAVVVVHKVAHERVVRMEEGARIIDLFPIGNSQHKALIHIPDFPMGGNRVLGRLYVIEGTRRDCAFPDKAIAHRIHVVAMAYIGQLDYFHGAVTPSASTTSTQRFIVLREM